MKETGINTDITVQDCINFRIAHGAPVSGLAIIALLNNWTPDTILDIPDTDLFIEIRAWKRKEKRLYNCIYRWLKWQYYRRL